jgi:hypothetical protein
MSFARASEESALTPVSSTSVLTHLAPAAESGSQALLLTRVWRMDARWLGGIALLYATLSVATALTLHAYFARTWDVVTFVGAGKIAGSLDWVNLYAQSRVDNYWPYAYPPLHAFIVAPFMSLSGFLPEWLMARVPPLLFDLALGVLLYVIVMQKTRARNLARAAMAVWLLNPVTWYDTTAQGHFEAEWLFFVALAYFLFERQRGWIVPTLALAVGFLFKQNAILFALPLWALLFFEREKTMPRRVATILGSFAVFALLIALISLPFMLRSNDYWFMNVQYVSAVPLQTQSWLVGLAGIFTPDNLFLRASSGLTFLAAAAIALFGARRGMNLWVMGLLLALAFFLLSKKAVGYYYAMLTPFALVTLLPLQRARALTLIVVATAFIFVAPYFASWAKPTHWGWYALLGVVNSALWLGLFLWLWRNYAAPAQAAPSTRVTVFVSAALFFAVCAAALVQPLVASSTSPIRAPLIAPGGEMQTLTAFFVFALLVSAGSFAARALSRAIARAPALSFGAYTVVILLAPLYFLTFAMTKEATAGFELLLKLIET